MAKVLFNTQNIIETPTLLLQHKNFETIGNGGITNVSGYTYKNNFNDANEISFKVHKFNNGIKHPLWDQLVDFKLIYIPELKERFEIAVTVNEEDPDDLSKSITGTALCESELSNINLHGVQINTETDMTNDLWLMFMILALLVQVRLQEIVLGIIPREIFLISAFMQRHSITKLLKNFTKWGLWSIIMPYVSC